MHASSKARSRQDPRARRLNYGPSAWARRDLPPHWVHMCRAPGKAALWALLGRPLDTFKSPCVNRWFQESCLLLGLRPPQDEKWVGHSHRSGGATGALSIEASFSLGQFVWSRMSMHLATICPPQPLGVGTSPCLRQSAWSGEGLPSYASRTPSPPSLSATRT